MNLLGWAVNKMDMYLQTYECWDWFLGNYQYIDAYSQEEAEQTYKDEYGGSVIQSKRIA